MAGLEASAKITYYTLVYSCPWLNTSEEVKNVCPFCSATERAEIFYSFGVGSW